MARRRAGCAWQQACRAVAWAAATAAARAQLRFRPELRQLLLVALTAMLCAGMMQKLVSDQTSGGELSSAGSSGGSSSEEPRPASNGKRHPHTHTERSLVMGQVGRPAGPLPEVQPAADRPHSAAARAHHKARCQQLVQTQSWAVPCID